MEITKEQRERWKADKEKWHNRAKTEIRNTEQLKAFADELVSHCFALKDGTDFYEQTVDSASAIAYAAIEMCSCQYGMTGFQIGCLLWSIIDKLMLDDHDCGMRLVNYNHMLYPQYEYKFEKTIDKDTWEALRKKAKELVEKNNEEIRKKNAGEKLAFPAGDSVAKHWESIANGEVPFGYTVVEK